MLPVTPSFEGHVIAAAVFAKRYSAAIGRSVTVASEVRNFPVFVVTNGGTPETVLRLVAKGLHATFRKDAGGYVITRTPEDRRQLNAQYTALNRRIVAEEIARFGADLTNAKRWGDPAKQFEAALVQSDQLQKAAVRGKVVDMDSQMLPDEFTPAGHLLHRVLTRLGPGAFESIQPFESRIFSNHPTADERGLKIDSVDLATFAKESRDFLLDGVYARRKVLAEERASPAPASDVSAVDPSSTTVVLRAYRRRDELEFLLSLFDATGRPLASSVTRTSHRLFGGNYFYILDRILAKPDLKWTPISEKLRRFTRALQLRPSESPAGGSTDLPKKQDRPSSFAEYIDVDREEPLANLLDDLLGVEASRNPTMPFVAALPDPLWSVGIRCEKPTGLIQDAFRPLAEGPDGDCEYLESSEGTVVRPRTPVLSESESLDRSVMARVYRDFIHQVPVSTESWLRGMGEMHDHYDQVNSAFLNQFRREQIVRITTEFGVSPEFYDLIGHVLARFPHMEDVPAGYELNTPQDHARLMAFLSQFLLARSRAESRAEEQFATKLLATGLESVKLTLVRRREELIQCAPEDQFSRSVGIPFDSFATITFIGPSAPDRTAFDAGISSRYDKPETRIAVTSREVLEVVFDLPRGIRQTLEIRNEPVPPTQGWRFAEVPKTLWDELFRITTRVKNGQRWEPAPNASVPNLPAPPPS